MSSDLNSPLPPSSADTVFGKRNPDGSYLTLNQPLGTRRQLKVICIGAGASGINLAYKVKTHLRDVEFVAYEKNPDIGGTWYENRYPGCSCDSNAHNYTFTYYPNPKCSSVYVGNVEIHNYLKDVVAQFDLASYFRLSHSVTSATWDPSSFKWVVTILRPSVPNPGSTEEFSDTCDILLNGAGLLNNWKWPATPGLLTEYKGALCHSANWEEGLEGRLEGKRVALIGVGSSGLQILPQAQSRAKSVTHFIRSRTWIAPDPPQRPYTAEEIEGWVNDPQNHLAFRKQVDYVANQKYKSIIKGSPAQAQHLKLWKEHMERELSPRQDLIDNLVPAFAAGCRRPTPAPGFMNALKQDNVTAVFAGIKSADATGLTDDRGVHHEFDVIICATGFDVSFRPRFPVIGTDGIDLRDLWATNPQAYLSMFTSGFPNYAMLLGPGAPSAQGSIIIATEIIADYIIQMIQRFQTEPIRSFDIKKAALDDMAEHMDAQLKTTVWSDACNSWFKNESGRITALHPGGRLHFFATLMNPRYEDFDYVYSNNRFAHYGNGFTVRELEDNDITWYLDYADGLKMFQY